MSGHGQMQGVECAGEVGVGAMIQPALGRRLRALRHSAGKTIEDSAHEIGITTAGLSIIERGFRVPSAKTILRIAEVYGISTDFILGCDGAPRPEAHITEVRQWLAGEGLEKDDIDFIMTFLRVKKE